MLQKKKILNNSTTSWDFLLSISEWTIIQLTAPYNPNENLKPFTEYRTEINSIYLTLFTNDYLEYVENKPITVEIPANVTNGKFIVILCTLVGIVTTPLCSSSSSMLLTTVQQQQHRNGAHLIWMLLLNINLSF